MNEADIPIDIHTGKLLDWLVSRRHVKKDWQKNILAIREKINNAIQDMPIHNGIAKLLSGSHINYFHCLKIIDILKETEADSKNLFGRYGSQRMKDWQEIVWLYEKDNVYLAEAAQLLVRNVNYEVPSLKKQIAKFEQLQSECDKKISEYSKREAASRAEFNSFCKQIGISGDKLKTELVQKLMELPEIYEKIGYKVSALKSAIELYTAFTKCIVGEQQAHVCVPLVKYIMENGNTTVYEWSYGEAPLSIQPDPIQIDLEVEEKGDSGEIDFGDSPTDGVAEIDFGNLDEVIDFGGDEPKAEDIDWGGINCEDDNDKKMVQTTLNKDDFRRWTEESLSRAIEAVHNQSMGVNQASKMFNIPSRKFRRYLKYGYKSEKPPSNLSDFGKENKESLVFKGHDNSLGDVDVNISLEESGIVVEGGGTMGGVAMGKDALTLLDNISTRAAFIDQLMELEAFLKMRFYEISTDTQFSTFSSLQDLPIESTDSIATMLGLVEITIGEMIDKKVSHLHNIKHSPRYVDTLAEQLKQKLTVSNKMNSLIDIAKQKKKETNEQAKAITPVLNLIITKTKELQQQIEADISKRYNKRIVNLMGGVKTL